MEESTRCGSINFYNKIDQLERLIKDLGEGCNPSLRGDVIETIVNIQRSTTEQCSREYQEIVAKGGDTKAYIQDEVVPINARLTKLLSLASSLWSEHLNELEAEVIRMRAEAQPSIECGGARETSERERAVVVSNLILGAISTPNNWPGFVWKVTGDAASHTVIGTIHACPQIFLENVHIKEAVECADVVYFEGNAEDPLVDSRTTESNYLVHMDRKLQTLARERQKRIVFFETLEKQEETVPHLRLTNANGPLLESLKAINLIYQWGVGGERFIDLIREDIPEELLSVLLFDRNEEWIKEHKLVDKLKRGSKSRLVVVGFAHTLWERGLIASFERAGLKVERLSQST